MELSSSNIKKFLIFSYISGNGTPPPKKIPYISGSGNPKKASYISGNENLHCSAQARKFLIIQETETPKKTSLFSHKKASFIFRETETPTKLLIFQETELSVLEK